MFTQLKKLLNRRTGAGKPSPRWRAKTQRPCLSVETLESRVVPALTILGGPTNGVVGWSNPSEQFSAVGGTGSDVWRVTSGALPSGQTLTASGVYGGVPTATGTYAFSVTATDSLGATATNSYTVTISPPLSTPITDLTQAAKLWGTYQVPTVVALNFDGWTNAQGTKGRIISPFAGSAAQIEDIIFRTSEIFAPFNVEVFRIYGNGDIVTGSPSAKTVFIGGDSNNEITTNSPVTKFSYNVTPSSSVDTPTASHAPSSNPSDIAFVDPTTGTGTNPAAWVTPPISQDYGIASAIAHETGHTFGLVHVRTDSQADPAPLAPGNVSDMMSYDSPNLYFANATLPTTAFNNIGPPYGNTYIPGNLPNYAGYDIVTQNSFTYMEAVAGVNPDFGMHAIHEYSVDPSTYAVPLLSLIPLNPNYTVGQVLNLNQYGPGDYNTYEVQAPSIPSGLSFRLDVTPTGSTNLLIPELLEYINPNLNSPGNPNTDILVQAVAGTWNSATGNYEIHESLAMGAGDDYYFALGAVGGGLTLLNPGNSAYTFKISVPLAGLLPATLPDWTVSGPAYSQTFTPLGGTAPVTFTVTSGAVPSGLHLSSTGILSGAPTTTGSYTFTVTVKDALGNTASQSYTVVINPTIHLASFAVSPSTVGVNITDLDLYSPTGAAIGGTGTVMFSVTSGHLPTGMTVQSTSNRIGLDRGPVLTGTPTAAGTYTFTITATDSVGASGQQTYTMVINPAVTIVTTALPAGLVDQQGYIQTIIASGGTGPLTFSVVGPVPPGLTFKTSGVLSGTPTSVGSYTFTVTATDSLGASGSRGFTVDIGQLGVLPYLLPSWTVNQPGYHQALTGLGGTAPYTFAVTVGALPPGLTLGSGVLSGTPSSPGSYSFTLTVTDSTAATGSSHVTVVINPPVTVSTMSLSNGTVNQAGYFQTIAAGGGTGSLTFSTTGPLPAGLALSSAGILAGTPTAAGSYPFTVTVTDSVGASSSKGFTVVIVQLGVLPALLPGWTYNQPGYDQTLTGVGGTAPYTFAVIAGALPPGLTLSPDGIGSVISGTPAAAGSYSFTVSVTDSVGDTASMSYVVIINLPSSLSLMPATLPNWTIYNPGYNQTLTASGGTGPYSYSETGLLPTGLTLSTGGVLSGAPIHGGSYAFTVTVTDSTSAAASQSYNVTINPPVTITTPTLPNWTRNEPGYNQTLSASGGTGTITFSLSNTAFYLPPGLVLSSAGVLSGTPIDSGSYTFTVLATDATGAVGGRSFTINIGVVLTPSVLPAWTVNQPGYSDTLTASGGTAPYTFGVTGTVPPGLNVGSDGVVAGTPTTAGSYSFTVTATDSALDTGSQGYLVVINPTPTITTTSLPDATLNGPAYYQVINASGGTNPLTFNVTSGTLPPGVALDSYGDLYGTPTSLGTFPFTVTVVDAQGVTASQSYTVTINPAVTISTTALPDGTVGQAYSQTITASGGAGPLTFTTADALPDGLTLGTSGILSGIPTTADSYVFTVTATDTLGASASLTYTVNIDAAAMTSEFQVTVLGASTVQAGSPILVTVQAVDASGNPITSYSGPPTASISTSPFTFGSTFPSTVAINSSGFGFFGGTLEQVGSYTISVANSAFSGSTSAPVTITTGVPVQLAFGGQPVNTPTGIMLPAITVQVEDLFGNVITIDNTDTVTVGIAGGPGSFTASSTTTATVTGGVATFNNLTLVTPGNYTLSALVVGSFTGPLSNQFTVAPLQVVPGSFAGTPSGFSLQFNAPFLVNSTTPVLYGKDLGATAPVPSVTLTQITDASSNPVNNAISGSLALNIANNSLTFIATNTTLEANNGSPLLPDGIYAVVVHSCAANDGLQALDNGGGFLDGLNNGTPGSGDFTATFTVNAAATNDDVLWVPATADGPGQALSAPGMNQISDGYPVYLSDSRGMVSNVQATLTYNAALLTITPISTSTFTVTVPSVGMALLQYNGPSLPVGSQTPIGFISATVPAGTTNNPTPYKAKDLLQLSGVSLNGGAVPVVTDDGLHLVAYVGDADGNGAYSSSDAVLITRVALQTDTGFAAYPLVDPVIVADTDGSGFIPADAALQVNEAGVGFPTANLSIPPIPSGVHFLARTATLEPQVNGVKASELAIAAAHSPAGIPQLRLDQVFVEIADGANLLADSDGGFFLTGKHTNRAMKTRL